MGPNPAIKIEELREAEGQRAYRMWIHVAAAAALVSGLERAVQEATRTGGTHWAFAVMGGDRLEVAVCGTTKVRE